MLRKDISNHVAMTAKAGVLSAGIVFLVSLGLYLLISYFSLIVEGIVQSLFWTLGRLFQAATLNNTNAVQTLSILAAVSAWLYLTSCFLYRKDKVSASVFHVGFRCSFLWLFFSFIVYLGQFNGPLGSIPFVGILGIFTLGGLGFVFMDLCLDLCIKHKNAEDAESSD